MAILLSWTFHLQTLADAEPAINLKTATKPNVTQHAIEPKHFNISSFFPQNKNNFGAIKRPLNGMKTVNR